MSTYLDLTPVEQRGVDQMLAQLNRMLVVRRLNLSVLPAPQSISDSTSGRAPVPRGAGVLSTLEHADA